MAASNAQLDEEMSVLADDKVMALTEADVHKVRAAGGSKAVGPGQQIKTLRAGARLSGNGFQGGS